MSRSELRRTLHATVQGAAAQEEPGGSQGAKKSVYVWGSNILAGQGRNPVQKVKLLHHSPYGGEGSVVNDATLLQRRIHFKLWILGNFPDTGEVCRHTNHVRNGGFRLVFLHLNLPQTAEVTEYHSALPERLVINWKEMHHLQELQYPITIFPLFPISSAHLTFLSSINGYILYNRILIQTGKHHILIVFLWDAWKKSFNLLLKSASLSLTWSISLQLFEFCFLI